MKNEYAKQDIGDILGLTPMQEGMLFHYLKESGGELYREQLCLEVSGGIDLKIFRSAWNGVVEANEMLRTFFRWEKINRPAQAILKEYKMDIEFHDLSALKGEGFIEPLLEEIKRNDRKRGFDLREVPFRVALCKIDRERHWIIVSNHHILYDGWSTGIILEEFFQVYHALVTGESKPGLPEKPGFKEFVRWHRRQDTNGQLSFWQGYLAGFDGKTQMPMARKQPLPENGAGDNQTVTIAVGNDIREKIEDLVKVRRTTLAAFFYTAWGVLLQRYCDTGDVVFGTTVSGRSAPIKGIEKMVGLFINTIPLRLTKENDKENASDLLERVNRALVAREMFENTQLVDIHRFSGLKSGEELFDSIMVIENYPLDHRLKEASTALGLESYSIRESTNYDITVSISAFADISIDLIYFSGIFEHDAVQRLAGHFKRIVETIADDPCRNIHKIELLSSAESRQLLEEFNSFEADYSRDKTLCGLFGEQVERFSDKCAVVSGPLQVTYGELNRNVNRLVQVLQEKGIGPGSIVAIMAERSLETLTGILGILKSGGAYLPIDPAYPQDRIDYILKDSSAAFLLTSQDIAKGGQGQALPLQPGSVRPDNLAYIIYTSGSTGRPKGVMIDHRSIVNTLFALQGRYPFGERDVYLLKTSFVFDVSVAELFGWYLGGGKLAILKKGGEKDPAEIVTAIENEGVTHINFVPSAFNALVEYLTDKSIDFPGPRYIFLAGEALPPQLVKRFRQIRCASLLENIYGPTEASIYGSWYSLSQWDGHGSIPIGKPLTNVKLYILDSHGQPQPIGVPGELHIAAAGLARGYLNRPELTAERFIDLDRSYGSYRSYKTGDLCRWMPDGNIQFLGRMDFQVKVRGYRIELGEIESHLLEYEGIREAVVVTREHENGEKYLCAYVVPEPLSTGIMYSLREYLSGRVPQYMVPDFFAVLESLPQTPSGKTDRNALPQPKAGETETYEPPRSELEKRLVSIWSTVLGVDASAIGINDNFFHMGGHSLNAVALSGRIHKAFNREIPLPKIFKIPTIRQLAQFLENEEKTGFAAIPAVEDGLDYYPLSPAQERLLVLHKMDETGTVYNIYGFMELEGGLDREKFQDVFTQLIQRHESFRTSFHTIDNHPVQRILDNVDFSIEEIGPIGPIGPIKDIIAGFIRPFDLSRAPLMRVGLAGIEEKKHLLMIDMHHIISDGTSMGVLVKEFMALYNCEALPAPLVRYRDFARWFNRRKAEGSLKPAETYWLEQFGDGVPILNMPTDFPRPVVQSFEGAHINFNLDYENTVALRAFARDAGTTMYSILVSLFTILLSKLGGQEDIVVGTPVAGRKHQDLSQVVGMFVNTLALRNFPAGEKSVKDFVREVGTRAVEAFEHQEYPFEDLVEKVAAARDASRNPLFDAMFAMLNVGIPDIRIPGLHLKPYNYDNGIAKFDFIFICEENADNLEFTIEYCTRLFREESIKKFITYFKQIVNSVLRNREKEIGSIAIITQEEAQEIVHRFNNFEEPFVGDKTIHDLFREQAEKGSDQCSLFRDRWYIAYGELNHRTDRLAYALREKGAAPGDMIGILAERSVEMIIGIIGILKAGCAYVPLNPKAPASRNRFMLNDCNVGVLLTTNDLPLELSGGFEVIGVEDAMNGAPAIPVYPLPGSPDQLAYVIYTSGSTGMPKGVAITHANFCQLIHWGYRHLGIGPKDRTLQNLSYYFDWSVWEIFITLTTGASLYMVPGEFLLNPEVSVQIMNTHGITVLHVTPTQYQYLVSAPTAPDTLRYLFIGAEKLTYDLVKRSFASVHEDCRVFNQYGPTEATIISATQEIHREAVDNYRDLSSVPIGTATGNICLFVLDRYLNLCPVNIAGELYISGEGVARGYLNNPELTGDKFIRLNRSYGSYRTYKTGDLARWLSDGTVEYLGRIDDQVKIRGFRIELGEIENRLLEHSLVKEAVVIARKEVRGDLYLCGYIVPRGEVDGEDLKQYLSLLLPDYMVPNNFTQLAEFPLNANGKVDRKALPAPGVSAGKRYEAPRIEREAVLAQIWVEVLEVDLSRIGRESNFFEVGGHSLKAALVMSKIHETFDVKLQLTEIFVNPTLRLLAKTIGSAIKEQYTAIEPVEMKEYYPVSSAQKRLYILQQLDPQAIGYNLPVLFSLEGDIDKTRMENAFNALVNRHESLRTSFHLIGGQPVQVVRDRVDFSIEYTSIGLQSFIRPFDLTKAPLLRVGMTEMKDNSAFLVMDIHHIVSDGFSLRILTNQFMALYNGGELSGVQIHYKDYAAWQRQEQEKMSFKQQVEFWLDMFSGEIPVLSLPCDHSRPPVLEFDGKGVVFKIGEDNTRGLNALALKEGATLFMTLLTLFNILLAKLSGQDDIVVGTPTVGRDHDDLQQMVGMFVNTLALRNEPAAGKTAVKFLKEVKEKTLNAFDNQGYLYEELVEKVAVKRDTGRNPLFDAMLSLQNIDIPEITVTGLAMNVCQIERSVSKFDLTLECLEMAGDLHCIFEYKTALFEEDTILRFVGYFKQLIAAVLVDPHKKIAEIEIIPGTEKEKLLNYFNDTDADFPKDKTIHQLFEEQAEKFSDQYSVISDHSHITYGELDQRANRLANALREKGVGPEAMVAIKVERSLEMVICIFGILKSGAAYLPIDPDYPQDRIDYILKDSRAALCIDDETYRSYRSNRSSSPAARTVDPGNLAYIIYTSGSTGKPKGVLVEHRAVLNTLYAMDETYPCGEGDVFLLKTAYTFDVSAAELFGWFMGGGSLAILERGGEKDPRAILTAIETVGVTHLNFVPSMFNVFVESLTGNNIGQLAGLKYIFLAGEALASSVVNRFREFNANVRLENIYGPTEAAIYACMYSLSGWDSGPVPIGRPLPNVQLYIMDAYDHIQPIGVAGELHIAGAGLARGYLNRPGLTAEKFVHLMLNTRHLTLYRTGDLCRWLPNGNIEYLGRIDHQVKVRGFRIELGEIEARLLEYGDIQEAVVTCGEKKSGEKYLCAYFTSSKSTGITAIREFLVRQLPGYMIPAYFMQLDELPLNTSGKLDRRRLPQPQVKTQVEYAAPQSGNEKVVSRIWQEVLEQENIGLNDNLFEIGGSSMDAVRISQRLKETFDPDIAVLDLFRYPTIRSLAASLGRENDDFSRKQSEIFDAINKGKRKNIDGETGTTGLVVAVIGMAGRFPGARDIDAFWENLKNGVESIVFFSDEELAEAGVSPDLLQNPNYVKAKGFLEDIDCFDSQFFGYTPGEAEVMDPQTRILHETVWEALEDAGYDPGSYNGRIGLYAGGGSSLYWESAALLTPLGDTVDPFTRSNLANRDYLCSRISYKLDLKGSAYMVNTACSTSLVAIELAVEALLNAKCEIALGGGVKVSLPHKEGYLYEPGMIVSPDGHCRAFDAAAQGTVGGEGAGIVVLKPLANAVADRDHIYAVVKGTATNNDGIRKVGFQAPSIEGQAEVIGTALYKAGVEPQSIGYVEAHGTGTSLGDPVEIEALKLAFGKNTRTNDRRNYCAVGSVKTNIGHLDTAAGIAGFIKAVLSLKHKAIPPSLHFETPNPRIDFENSPFYVNTQFREWRNERYPLRAGVSSFGIGGTNACVVLEEWRGDRAAGENKETNEDKYRLILLSAKSESALDKMTGNLVDFFAENPAALADTAYTLQVGRKHMEHRRMVVGASAHEIIENASTSSPAAGLAVCPLKDAPKIIFMFPGLGAQYVNMGRGLYDTEPVFRDALDNCFNILLHLVKEDVKDILYPAADSTDPVRPELTQPVVFSVQYALARLLVQLGITPHAMIGYSFGEYVAACISGVFSLEDALQLIVARGKLVEKTAPGAMLSVPLPKAQVIPFLAEHHRLSLAIDNGPSSIVAGPDDALAVFEKEMKKNRLLCMRVQNTRAFHSKMMAPIVKEFESEVGARVVLNEPEIPYISNVTGTWATPRDVTAPSYWARHLEETVQFADGIRELIKIENAVFLEIGPGRDLSALLVRYKDETPGLKTANLIRHREQKVHDSYFLVNKLGRLWLWGVGIDWEQMYPGEQRRRLALPKYPFKKTQFWIPHISLRDGLDNMAGAAAVSKKKFMDSMQPETPDGAANDSALHAFRRPELSTAYVPPQPDDKIMTTFAQIWGELFGIREVGINDDFFELGGDSLKAMTVLTTIHKELSVEIPLTDFFEHPTISALAEYTAAAGESSHFSVSPAEKKEYYLLSSVQQRMYFLHQLDPDSTGYNISTVMEMEGELDTGRMEQVFRQLIARHESLRTSFHMVGDQAVQIVHDTGSVDFSIEEIGPIGPIGPIKNSNIDFIRPFDLSHAPLIRVGLSRVEENRHIFIVDMHHIVGDGTSFAILIREFTVRYAGGTLPRIKLQYKDYSRWKNSPGEVEKLKRQEEFWLNQFIPGEEIPLVNLPTDYSRPLVRSDNGNTVPFAIDVNDVRALIMLASKHSATLYMVLLAIYDVFLSRLSGQEELIVGTPTAGRPHTDLGNIVGMFVNTLVLRNRCTGEKYFTEFLEEVKDTILGAFVNQDFQYETLVEKTAVARDPGRNPLFDTMFILQNVDVHDFSIPGVGIKPFYIENTTAKFDLTITCHEGRDSIACFMEYSTDLFKVETIHRFIKYLKQIVSDVVTNPGKKISEIDMLPEEEKRQLLFGFNDTAEPFPIGNTIYELFEKQVDAIPDCPVLEFRENIVSFRHFDEKANQLANYLRSEKGLSVGDRVLVSMERSLELIVALMGVMKAGGTYVPLDPRLPAERLRIVLSDASIGVVISQGQFSGKFSRLQEACEGLHTLLYLDDPQNGIDGFPVERPGLGGAENPAYVMYTSGSSGVPKGVLVEHRTIVNTLIWRKNFYDYKPGDVSLQIPPYFFDSSVTDIFTPLLGGARLVMVSEDQRVNLSMLRDVLPAKKVTHFIAVPAFYNVMVEEIADSLKSVKKICCAGEHFPDELIRKHFEKLPHVGIVNEYGPTENSVNTTAYELKPGSHKALIGSPISNVQVTVRDRYMNFCPVGVGGEMFLSGASLARGYLNRPQLTAEKFVYFYRSNRSYRSYKTGDMARWLPCGNLEFLGRLDNQVKIRGIRVEVEEIENHIMKRDDIKEAVVLAREDSLHGGERYLCAYVVSSNGKLDGKLDTDLKSYLAQRLPQYMVPSHIMELEAIPFTSTGKIDRSAFPAPRIETGEFAAPRNDAEKTLAKIWEAVLGRERVGINDNFFSVGGDSIKSIQIMSRLNNAGYKLEVKDIFQFPTIAELAPHVRKSQRIADQSPVTGDVPLTPIQHAFFNGSPIDPHHYNQAVMLYSAKGFDKEIIESVFTRLQEHHDALRMTCSIDPETGGVRQIDQDVDLPLSLLEYSPGADLSEKVNHIQASIKLETGPLMQLGLFHKDDGDRLLIVVHHLVIDGISWRILLEDFDTLYEQIKNGQEPELPLKTDSFKLWSETLREYACHKSLLKERDYWSQLDSQPAPVIPKDLEGKENLVKDTGTISFSLEEAETGLLLNNVNQCYNTGINDILLTALGFAVRDMFGHDRVAIALEGHGREALHREMDVSRTVGWFTTEFPVLLDMSFGSDTGRQIKEVKETLRKVPNKGIGYGVLIYLGKEEIDVNLKPQIIFNYLGQFDADVKGAASFEIARESTGNSRGLRNSRDYELEFDGMIVNNRLSMTISYNNTRFKPGTMAALSGHFQSQLQKLISFCASRESVEPTPSDFIYKGLAIDGLQQLLETYAGADVEEIYPLSPMQEGMLFHALVDEGSDSYFQQTAYRLQGELDIPLVKKSLDQLFVRHDILRTAFVHKDVPRPLQLVLKNRSVDFYYEDITHITGSEEKEIFCREFKAADKKRCFDLSTGILGRVSILQLDNRSYEFVWSFHHILMDGWCIGILNSEFFEIYNANLHGKSARMPGVKPYRTYIQWLEKQDREESGRYWETYLDDFEEQSGISKTKVAEDRPTYQNEEVLLRLGNNETTELNKLAARNNVTLNTVTQAAWGVLLGKYNGKEDVVFGSVVSGRPYQLEDVESMVGLFINTVPVRIRFQNNLEFKNLLQSVQQEYLDGEPYHYHPLADIQSHSSLKQNLLDHLLAFENYSIAEQIQHYGSDGGKENDSDTRPPITLTDVDVFEQTNYDFNITLAGSEQLTVTFKYNANAVGHEYVKRMAGHFRLVLSQVMDDENMEIGELTLISPKERQQILVEFNDTASEYPADKTVHQLFEAQAERTPDAICVLCFASEGNRQLTYKELDRRSGRLACKLMGKGLPQETIVGIMSDRSLEMIIGILGILKAGGCYMPIDPSYPGERIDFLLKNSNAGILLTADDMAPEFTNGIETVSLTGAINCTPTTSTQQLPHSPSNSCYIMHTSGSTGKPKGVMVEHRSVVRLVKNTGYVEFNAGDRILQTGALDFDASTFEIWGALLNGLSLVLVDKADILTPERFKASIRGYCISTLFLTTGLFLQLMQEDIEVYAGLVNLLVGGEVMPPDRMNRLRRHFPGLNIIHCYGPTENTTFSTTHLVNREYTGHVTIGKAIANSTAYIVDKTNRLQPIGIPGELLVGGDGVARGYLNSPEMTEERFVVLYWSNRSYRTYRTGDLAKWLPDGNLEFMGRIDQQVKIRGFRIEPGEIENRILQYPEVKEAVVMARRDGSRKYLCAYYTVHEAKEEPDSRTPLLKKYLENTLPDYMVPACFVHLDVMPLGSTGKVSRGKLPEPMDSDFHTGGAYQAPVTRIQRAIAETWEDVLGREKVSIQDDFFDLGGNSLDLVSVANKLRAKLKKEIPVAILFNYPTISQLEQYLSSAKLPGATIDVPVNFVLLNSSPKPEGNIFFIHEILGDVGAYMAFSQQLGARFNCWGVEAEKLKNYVPRNETVEEISTKYIAQMKIIQPGGPYYLATWSWGGHLVLEMALQLERMGEKLSLLAFVDCIGPDCATSVPLPPFTLEGEKIFLNDFFTGFGTKMEMDAINDIQQLWVRAAEVVAGNPALGAHLKQLLIINALALPDYDDLTGEELIQYLNLNRTHLHASSRYIPSGKPQTPVHYFWANQNDKRVESWGDYCQTPVIYHEVNGSHHSIFRDKEQIAGFAEVFKKVLDQV